MTAIDIVQNILGVPTFTPEGIILYAAAAIFSLVVFNTVCDIVRLIGSSLTKWT